LGGSYADTGGLWRIRALSEEQTSEKVSRRILSGDQGMVVWWSIGAGVHVEPHSHANEQIVWMLKGKMEFRLGSEQRVCGPGDVVVIPGGMEHEAWFREDTEVIDFFAPPRDDFLLGGKPAYMSEAEQIRRRPVRRGDHTSSEFSRPPVARLGPCAVAEFPDVIGAASDFEQHPHVRLAPDNYGDHRWC